ncbi:hypothetical protein FOL47_009354 [Perkinsus chesapeaki]|uniref:Uncharacterized protein n=1 Tax=Perkinsus chesapeaki TaxID=330153 RepID=A0A7J6L8Q6_PERCH|nr:hypothetical protein FOL47_009354 [Perkinsus chesapeaki]
MIANRWISVSAKNGHFFGNDSQNAACQAANSITWTFVKGVDGSEEGVSDRQGRDCCLLICGRSEFGHDRVPTESKKLIGLGYCSLTVIEQPSDVVENIESPDAVERFGFPEDAPWGMFQLRADVPGSHETIERDKSVGVIWHEEDKTRNERDATVGCSIVPSAPPKAHQRLPVCALGVLSSDTISVGCSWPFKGINNRLMMIGIAKSKMFSVEASAARKG